MKVRLIAAVGMAAATIVVAAPVARADGWAALAALATCTNDVDDPVVVTVTENVDQSVNLAVACHARIDLNGHTVQVDHVTIATGATLTIDDVRRDRTPAREPPC